MSEKIPQLDLVKLAGDGRHFARLGEHGFMEVVDSLTGRTIAVLNPNQDTGVRSPVVETRLMDNGELVLVETSLPQKKLKHMPYDPWVVDIICQKIAQGGNLTKICKEPGMPEYSVFCNWRRRHPDIDRLIDEAKKDRTEFLRDQAVTIAMDNEDFKFPTQAAKLKVDTLFTAAGFDNAKYSPKAKLDVSVSAPTQIIVATGINRDPLPVDTSAVEKEAVAASQEIINVEPKAPSASEIYGTETGPPASEAGGVGEIPVPGDF